MKKISALLIAAAVAVTAIVAFVVISGNAPASGNAPTTGGETEPGVTAPKETEGNTQETLPPSTSGKIWEVPTYDIYATYPDGWPVVKKSGVHMLMKTTEAMVSITYSRDESIGNSLEKAIIATTEKIIDNVYAYCEGRIGNSKVEVKSTTKCKMGGFDALKFNGSISSAGEYDCHVYGYTVIIDGVGVTVCSIVTARAQDAQMIAEFDALADQVAATVRTTK